MRSKRSPSLCLRSSQMTERKKKLEANRLKAAELFAAGCSPSHVRMRFDVSRPTIARWHKKFLAGGAEQMIATISTGRPRRLTEQQSNAAMAAYRNDPKEQGFNCKRWSCQLLSKWIEREFGVKYHPDHVGKMVKIWGTQK